ncbi:MAG: response regulator [Bacteroidota bacterium]
MYYRLNNRRNSAQKKHILIIEDNKFMLTLLNNILSEDFSVHTFSSADDAKYWIKDGNSVDVIISDINLDESNGIDLAKDLKSDDRLRNIPFIFLTGMSEKDLTFSPEELKYEAFISKPFNPGSLIDQIKQVA